jgi:hypothetical protein
MRKIAGENEPPASSSDSIESPTEIDGADDRVKAGERTSASGEIRSDISPTPARQEAVDVPISSAANQNDTVHTQTDAAVVLSRRPLPNALDVPVGPSGKRTVNLDFDRLSAMGFLVPGSASVRLSEEYQAIKRRLIANTTPGILPNQAKGISMFLIPKFPVGDDGSLGARNDVHCAKLEHKLGIHGSPTCVLNYGDGEGAVGWLIGEPNRGLTYMFTMMNQARLGVGVQGVGLAEHAYQDALAYARERKQGSVGGTVPGDMTPIINHPDVRRMLLSMKAKIAAARAICSMNAVAIDLAKHAADAPARANADALAALLTPVSKAYGSDIAVEVASEGIQVHGGMGYIEETGVAQHYRDARIAPIYEGTNGIQNVDLVTRKLPLNNGATSGALLDDLKATVREVKASNEPAFGAMADCLADSVADLEEASHWLARQLGENREAALAGASSYGRLFANAAGGVFLARGALAAARGAHGSGNMDGQITLARHFAETQAPLTAGLKRAVQNTHETVLGRVAEAAFS